MSAPVGSLKRLQEYIDEGWILNNADAKRLSDEVSRLQVENEAMESALTLYASSMSWEIEGSHDRNRWTHGGDARQPARVALGWPKSDPDSTCPRCGAEIALAAWFDIDEKQHQRTVNATGLQIGMQHDCAALGVTQNEQEARHG